MVAQYLQDEGFGAASMTLLDEANVKMQNTARTRVLLAQMKKAILEGNWEGVEQLCSKHMFRNKKSFLYAIAKQQYFELMERNDVQQAFDFLLRRLKPLEDVATPEEFRDLCYVLTCRSVQVGLCFILSFLFVLRRE